MEDEYGKTLVSITSTSGSNTLTRDGKRVLESGKRVLQGLKSVRDDNPKTTLRVAASHLPSPTSCQNSFACISARARVVQTYRI